MNCIFLGRYRRGIEDTSSLQCNETVGNEKRWSESNGEIPHMVGGSAHDRLVVSHDEHGCLLTRGGYIDSWRTVQEAELASISYRGENHRLGLRSLRSVDGSAIEIMELDCLGHGLDQVCLSRISTHDKHMREADAWNLKQAWLKSDRMKVTQYRRIHPWGWSAFNTIRKLEGNEPGPRLDNCDWRSCNRNCASHARSSASRNSSSDSPLVWVDDQWISSPPKNAYKSKGWYPVDSQRHQMQTSYEYGFNIKLLQQPCVTAQVTEVIVYTSHVITNAIKRVARPMSRGWLQRIPQLMERHIEINVGHDIRGCVKLYLKSN